MPFRRLAARFDIVFRLGAAPVPSSLFSIYTVLFVPLSALSALLLCLFAEPIAIKLRLLDIPGGRKSHQHPTPLMGGLAFLLAFCPWALIWAFLAPSNIANFLFLAMACSAVTATLGVLDDRKHIPAIKRLLVCFGAITLALFIDPSLLVTKITWNHGHGLILLPRIVGIVLCVFSVVSLIQGANLADGKNGLLISLCLVWIYFLSIVIDQSLHIVLMGLAGVLMVLLVFNLSGRLFLGDGGSYSLATFIGLCAIYIAGDPHTKAASDQIALIFLLPVMDMIRLMTARAIRGTSPFAADRDHLHHHLLTAVGWPGGLAVYLMLAILPNLVAVSAPRWTLTIIAITVVAYLMAIYGVTRITEMRQHTQRR